MADALPGDGRAAEVLAAIPELELISDPSLRAAAVGVWARAWELSGASDLRQAILLAGLSDAATGLLHVRSMIRLATDAATTMRDVYGIPIDVDVVAAGAALHDVCKVVEYADRREGTLVGAPIHHAFTGAWLALDAGLPPEVVQVVAYHSEYADVLDRSLESLLVASLDMASVDGLIRKAEGVSLREYLRGLRG